MPRPVMSDLFRDRLGTVIDRTGLTQAGFARRAGIDRSTLSQLLSPGNPRLPRADTLAAIATTCQVSVDWLLGLSQRRETGPDLIESVLQVEAHARSPIDARFVGWLREAEGHRVRTVTEGFSDFLKTEEVIRFEYQGALAGRGTDAIADVAARLALMRRPDSHLEACASLQAFTTMALAEGKWNGLGLAARRRQLDYMIALYDELYPSLRVYLYTLTETYANPFTVFGPTRAALFLGTSYLVLTAPEHVRLFSRRFDDLIRLAVVQPNQIGDTLRELRSELG